MDKRRAKQIVASPIMADVTYNEMPIYIENVNGNKATANVRYLNESGNVFEVPLNKLFEH